MKTLSCLLLLFTLIFPGVATAQNNEDARTLVKDGMKLSEEKKYTEAIGKYSKALEIDTGYLFAGYQLASALFSSGNGANAIPYLEKIIRKNTSLNAAAYELMGLVYFHGKQYAEAERCAVEAIKVDPKHATSQRMYALVCFHQNKRAAALLGFCSFILLEPNTARSAEAYENIRHILQGGELKPEPGVLISPHVDANTSSLNQAITKAVAEAGKQKYPAAADQLTAQLKNIFIAIGQMSEKQNGDDFFGKFLAAYFYRLSQSPNMPAFARLVSSSIPESAKWIKDNPQPIADLENWVNNSARGF